MSNTSIIHTRQSIIYTEYLMSLTLEPTSASPSRQTQDEALAWFSRLQDSQVSQLDQAEFSAWLAASPSHQDAYDKVVKLWQSPALNEALSHYATIPFPIKSQEAPSRRWLTAASIVLMGAYLLSASGLVERWQADVITATGEQRHIVLADGSAVTLNTDTRLVFNDATDKRGVTLLDGEAYFEVQPDKSRPFIVTTEQGTVRVVGTRFAVKTGDSTQVDVESGIVACTSKQGETRQLIAGQHTHILDRGVEPITTIDTNQVFAWLNGRIIFQDQPLAEVIAELDRYHPGAIVITDSKLAGTHVTGNYKLEDTTAIVNTLAGITGAHVVNFSTYLTVLKL